MDLTQKSTAAEKKSLSLLPVWAVLLPLIPVCLIPMLAHQPKEVTAAVYSAVVAVGAVVAGIALERKARRKAAIVASAVCLLFTGLFVLYAYFAYVT
jgi:hypothetical protein